MYVIQSKNGTMIYLVVNAKHWLIGLLVKKVTYEILIKVLWVW